MVSSKINFGFQIDRTAVCEVDDKSNGDIAIEHRLEWMKQLRRGDFDHLSLSDLKKYLSRGTQQMPWTEMSQSDFLIYVVPNELLDNEQLLESSISIMRSVVENPGTTQYSKIVVYFDKLSGAARN